jgi:hypothetical protein
MAIFFAKIPWPSQKGEGNGNQFYYRSSPSCQGLVTRADCLGAGLGAYCQNYFLVK